MNTNSCIINADATDPENQRGDDNDNDNDNMKSFALTCDGMDAGTGTGTGTALASTKPRASSEIATPIVAATSIGIDKPNNSNDKAFLSSGNSIHSSSMSSLTCTSSLSSMTLSSSLSVSLSSMSSSSSSSLPWSTSTSLTSSSRARELLDSMKARRECLRHAVHANDESTTTTRTTTASSPAHHLSLLGSQSLQPQPLEPTTLTTTTTPTTSSPTVLLLAQQQMQQSLLGRRNMLLRMARRQSENEHRLLHSNVYVSQEYGLEQGQGLKFSRSEEADENNRKANPALSANNMRNKQEHEREASSSTASLTEESSLSPPSSPPQSPSSSKSVSSSSTTTTPKIIFQSKGPQLDLHAASAEEASETSDAWRPALVSTIASLASLDSKDLDFDSRQPIAAVEINQSGGINDNVKNPFRLMQWNDLDLPSPLLLQSTQSNASNKQLQLPSLSPAAPTSKSSSLTSSPQTSATGTSTTTQRSAYLDRLYRPSDKALSPCTRPLRRSTRGYRRPRNERVPAAALQPSSPKSTPSQTPPHSSPGASTHSTRNKHEAAVSLLSNPTTRRELLQRLLFEQQQQQQQEAVANNHDPDLQWRPPIMVSSAHAEIVRAFLICTASSSNKGLVNGDDQEDYEFVEDNDGSIDNNDDYEGTLLNSEFGDDDDDSFDCTTDSNTSGWISQTDDDLEGGDIGSGTDSSLIDLDDTDEFVGDFWDDTLPVNDTDQTPEIVTDASASSCMEPTRMGSLVQHNAGNEKDNDNDDDAPVSATNETTCDDVEPATTNAVATANVTDPIVQGHGIEKPGVVDHGLHSQQDQEDETALSNDEPGKTEMSWTDASDHVNDDANVAVTGHSAIQMLSSTPDNHDSDDEIHSDTPFAHGERLETVYETLDECSEDGGDEPRLDEDIVLLECGMLNDVWVTSNNALKGNVDDDDDFAASYENKNECFLQDEATAGSTESSSSSLSSTQSDECAIETGCDLMDASDVCGIYPIQWSIDLSKSDQAENLVAEQDDEGESHGNEGIDKMLEHRADLDACAHDLRMMSCTSVHSDDTVDDWKHERKPKSGQIESSEVEEGLDPKIEMDFNVPCESVTDIIDKELEIEVAVPGSVEVVANALFVEENASDRMCKAAGGTFYLAVLSPGWIDARSCRIKDPASPSKQVLRLSNDFLCGANGSLYNIALRSGCTIQIPEEQIQRRYVKRRRRRQRSSTTSTTSSVSSGGRGGTYYLCTRSGLTKQVMRSCQPYEVTVHVRPRSESNEARILPEDETDALCGAKGSLYMLGKSYS